MREILFRGKGSSDGAWHYGSLDLTEGNTRPIILEHDGEFDIGGYLVDPETVGQYTGLKDKNGTRIFEGDIIEYNGTKHKVVFENRLHSTYFGIVMSAMETWGFSNSVPANMMEVIGNIYDNPELLEGERNG